MALVNNLAKICNENTGGLALFWAIDVADVTNVEVLSNEITAITLAGGASWKKYEFRDDSGQRLNTGERSEGGSFSVAHIVNFSATGIDTPVITVLHEFLASNPCGFLGLCKDMNGNKWLEGYSETLEFARPLKLISGALDSGTATTDAALVDFSLSSSDGKYALKFLGADPS